MQKLRCSTLLVMRKLQIKITIKYHCVTRSLERLKMSSAGDHVEALQFSYNAGPTTKDTVTLENVWWFLKIEAFSLTNDISHTSYPRE